MRRLRREDLEQIFGVEGLEKLRNALHQIGFFHDEPEPVIDIEAEKRRQKKRLEEGDTV